MARISRTAKALMLGGVTAVVVGLVMPSASAQTRTAERSAEECLPPACFPVCDDYLSENRVAEGVGDFCLPCPPFCAPGCIPFCLPCPPFCLETPTPTPDESVSPSAETVEETASPSQSAEPTLEPTVAPTGEPTLEPTDSPVPTVTASVRGVVLTQQPAAAPVPELPATGSPAVPLVALGLCLLVLGGVLTVQRPPARHAR